MTGKDRAFWILFWLTVLDILVFAAAWVPTLLGHVGSESHEWTMVAVIVTSQALGSILIPILLVWAVIRWLGRRSGPSP